MTITELIAKLQELRRIHGDLPVFHPSSEEEYDYETNSEVHYNEYEMDIGQIYEALGKCYIT